MARLALRSRHRIGCGDSSDPTMVNAVMADELAVLLFTSPPYAQQRDYGTAKGIVGDWDRMMQGIFAIVPMADDGQVLVNLGLVHRDCEWIPYWDGWIEWMRQQGWRRFGWYVWDQGPGLPGDWNGRLAPSHEFIFHFNRVARAARKSIRSKTAGAIIGQGGLRGKDGTIQPKTQAGQIRGAFKIRDSVFRAMRQKGGIGDAGTHPAVFSVALAEEALDAYSNRNDLIFEPFIGSGTTVIAAERTSRRCYGIDIDPAYVDVAVRRWQLFTGRQAIREADGRTYEEASDGRT